MSDESNEPGQPTNHSLDDEDLDLEFNVEENHEDEEEDESKEEASLLSVLVPEGEDLRRRGEQAYRAGETVATYLSRALRGWAILMYRFLTGLLSKVPKTGALADAVILGGYKWKKKLTGADVLVHTIYGDGVVLPSAGYWQSDESEYLTEHGERFSAKGVGFDPKLIGGKVPAVWALREGREITEPIEAYMGAQRRLGNYEPHVRPDGGTDVAIDAETGGYDGRALSFRDGWDLFGSKITQEDMDLAEKRGKIAELEGRYLSNEVKTVLLVLGGVALGLFGPALAASIAGGASGGGGGFGGGMGALPGLGGVLLPLLGVL